MSESWPPSRNLIGYLWIALIALFTVLPALGLAAVYFLDVPPPIKSATSIGASMGQVNYVTLTSTPRPTRAATVRMTVRRLDVSNLQVAVDAKITFPPAMLVALVGPDLDPVFVYTSPGSRIAIKDKYQALTVTLRVASSFDDFFRVGEAAIPLNELVSSYWVGGSTVYRSLTLPLIGRPAMYPNDWYWWSANVSLELPGPIALRHSDREFEFMVPFALQVGLDRSMFGLTAHVEEAERASLHQQSLGLVVKRDFINRSTTRR